LQKAVENTTFATPLSVSVTDAYGNPIATQPVFSVTSGSATLSDESTTVDGVTSIELHSLSTVGLITVSASVPNTSLTVSFTEDVMTSLSQTLTQLNGFYQTAAAGSNFAQPLTVLAQDGANNPVANDMIRYYIQGPATFAGGSPLAIAFTSAVGVASAPTLVAGTTTGSVTVTAVSSGTGAMTVFTENVATGPASSLLVTGGDGQSDNGQGSFAHKLGVQLTDVYGNPVLGARVQFNVVQGPGYFATQDQANSPITYVQTNETGAANQSLSHLDALGTITVVASVIGTNLSVQFTENLTQAPTTTLVVTPVNGVTGNNQATTAGTSYHDSLAVLATDAWGKPVPGDTVTFAVTQGQGLFANGHASVAVISGSNGVATAPVLSAVGQLGSLVVTASSSLGMASATFNELVTVGAPASVVIQSGRNQTVKAGYTPAPLIVQVLDGFGNPEPSRIVDLSINGTLYLANATNASGLTSIDLPVPTLVASNNLGVAVEGSSLTTATNETVVAGDPTTEAIVSNPYIAAAPSQVVGPDLAIKVTDAYGNAVPNAPVSFTLSSAAASFASGGSATVTTDVSGIATAPTLTAGKVMTSFSVAAVPVWSGASPAQRDAAPVFLGYISRVAPTASTVALAAGGRGYWKVSPTGQVTSFGSAPNYGSANLPGVTFLGLIPTADNAGYWLADTKGKIYAFGDAKLLPRRVSAPQPSVYVSFNATPDGMGYWLTTRTGLVVPYGDASDYQIQSRSIQRGDVIAMAPTPDGGGYWTLSSKGGVTAYGDALWYGNDQNVQISPVVSVGSGLAAGGYIAGANGATQSLGLAPSLGSNGAARPRAHVVSILPTADGGGYWITNSWGQIDSFGNAPWRAVSPAAAGYSYGVAIADPAIGVIDEVTDAQGIVPTVSLGTSPLSAAHDVVASTPAADGGWIISSLGQLTNFGAAPYVSPPNRTSLAGAVSAAATKDGHGLYAVTALHSVVAMGNAAAIPARIIAGLKGSVISVATATNNASVYALTNQGYVYLVSNRKATATKYRFPGSVAISSVGQGTGVLAVSASGVVHSVGTAKTAPLRSKLSSSPVIGLINGRFGYWVVQLNGAVTAAGRP